MKIKKTALILFILLLLISLAATPLWALSSETSAQTTGEAFEELTDPPFSDELGTAGDHGENETRSNDEIVSATYLEDGVYAFRNVGNGNFWMDVRANNYTSSTNMQQYYTTTLPTDSFERSLLYKVTRVGTTNRYIIRLMLNNRLTFDFSGNNVMTKVIPAKDSEVAAVDTFAITRSGSGYTIRPNDSSYLVSANSSQASGSAGDPDSNLVKKTPTAAGNCGIWELHRYTGTSRSGVSVSMSPTIPDGLTVGDHTLVSFATWSTVADANTPHLEVSSSFASRASIIDVSVSTGFRAQYSLEGVKAGKVQLTYRIKNASGANTYNAYQTHLITPDFYSPTVYLQNKATQKYMYTPTSTAGASIQQYSFSTSDQKQWELYKAEGGYYCIMSPYSEKFVGISASDTATVRQYETANDYATWYLHETDSGGYAFINKALGALNRAIAPPADTSGDGATLTVTAYTNDSSYRDEWEIDSVAYEFIFCGIPDSGHDHSSVLYNTKNEIMNYSCECDIDVQVYDTTLSASKGLEYLEDAAVFTIRCHGVFHSDSSNTVLTTFISLNNSTGRIYSHSYPSVPPAAIVLSSSNDFSQLDLVLFTGCHTGEGGPDANNLTTKVVEYGARVAIGFIGEIGCKSANDWTQLFYGKLLEGKTAKEAFDYANEMRVLNSIIYGDGSYRLP